MPENHKPTLMFFTSDWCANCKRMKPIVTEIKQSYADKVNTVEVDVAKEPDTAAKYDVLGIPTVVVVDDGKVLERFTGFVAKEALLKKLGVA